MALRTLTSDIGPSRVFMMRVMYDIVIPVCLRS